MFNFSTEIHNIDSTKSTQSETGSSTQQTFF